MAIVAKRSRKGKKKEKFVWRMEAMCDNCPFAESGEGLRLRETLRPGRFEGIKRSLLDGQTFWCHKTTHGKRLNLYCAGALAFQAAHGIETPYMAICKSFEGVRESKNELFRRLRGAIGRG